MENPERPEPAGGTLYVVSTPIGNLRDITLRALDILRSVDIIAAEDTRTTRVLLDAYNIDTECMSCHSRNENRRTHTILRMLEEGKSVAVVSDAGTPALSDPAGRLIAAAIDAGFPVIPIPGPSAALAALVASGFRMDRFRFEGFLPLKRKRRARLAELATETRTVILYESVHRLRKTLVELRQYLGPRRVSVSRELTKRHEETVRGSMDEVIEYFERNEPRGEFVIVIAPPAEKDTAPPDQE
ncbi:MAG: 16S rRNA (cytidine(1402)-2'-O)-methyltransferase [Bacteroidota bacterium]|nr:16S rRNA (cytidine(1402)-2'-O)-methyltransferase [Bacteroidota bacterium]